MFASLCKVCTPAPPPAPNMHTWGILPTKHIGTEPLSTIRSHFTAKKKKQNQKLILYYGQLYTVKRWGRKAEEP